MRTKCCSVIFPGSSKVFIYLLKLSMKLIFETTKPRLKCTSVVCLTTRLCLKIVKFLSLWFYLAGNLKHQTKPPVPALKLREKCCFKEQHNGRESKAIVDLMPITTTNVDI